MIKLKEQKTQIKNLKELSERNSGTISISEIQREFPSSSVEDLQELCEYLDAVGITVSNDNNSDTSVSDSLSSSVNDCDCSQDDLYEDVSGLDELDNSFSSSSYVDSYGYNCEYTPLTKEQEQKLIKEFQDGRKAQEELEKFEPYLGEKEIKKLKIRINCGKLAQEDLYDANKRLVSYVLKKYIGRGLPEGDLFQEGCDGLIHAFAKFDTSQGTRISTYAVWWIRQNILRAIQKNGRIIRLPNHVFEDLRKYYTAVNNLLYKSHNEPTDEDVAKELGVSVDKARELRENSYAISSLDVKVGDDENSSMADLTVDNNALSGYDYTLKLIKEGVLDDAIEKLNARERIVITYYFGLNNVEQINLEEIGVTLGLSRERVRQIKENALKKLRSNPQVQEYFNPKYESSYSNN